MSLPPPILYGRATVPRLYPTGTSQHSRAASETTPLLQKPNTAGSNPLQSLGIPRPQAQKLLHEIAANHDQPYHAGRLWNGNAYLITQNDTVYYGKPAHLKKRMDVIAYRTKCIDQQVRRFQMADGLCITVSNQQGQQRATADTCLLGLAVPLPHRAQAAFDTETPILA